MFISDFKIFGFGAISVTLSEPMPTKEATN